MSVDVSFWAGEDFAIESLSGSGLGFFASAGFGSSVSVGSYNGRTFITNGAGTTQGPECDNIYRLNAGSGVIGQAGTGIALTCIPNYQATLGIRIESSDASTFRTTNSRCWIYDRTDTGNPASGVSCYLAEIIHPNPTQTNVGSGDTTWTLFSPSLTGVYLSLAPSPGISGLTAGNGTNGGPASSRHDLYIAISASPDTVGSKSQFGLYFETEYL